MSPEQNGQAAEQPLADASQPEGRKKPGRKPYIPTEEDIAKAREAAAGGCNLLEIAEILGISVTTLKAHRAEFADALKKGREDDRRRNVPRVESKLLQRCLGYTYKEEQVERRVGGDGKVQVVTRQVTRHVHPSDVAIFFYLANRAPAAWQHIGRIDKPIQKDNEIPVRQDFIAPAARKPAEAKGDMGDAGERAAV